ncbi:hypothetical protein ONE63_002459 [Megalurothrips usitatus]|uniref:Secreted protein n=1 Tax=Megalurothrips usitatus TaxID=439358 RepID=A0AAV7X887_9NEOP|nr:hypothetical protein ONE63_002459 [Megalurothrips usitatus]
MAPARTARTARTLAAVLCVLVAMPAVAFGSSASSSSSAEDGMDLEEAAVERCVRIATPALISGGSYDHLGKIDPCVNDGLNGLEDGKAPAAMARQIVACIGGKPFPDALKATVDALNACITAALP